jgi:hypothetical protein
VEVIAARFDRQLRGGARRHLIGAAAERDQFNFLHRGEIGAESRVESVGLSALTPSIITVIWPDTP